MDCLFRVKTITLETANVTNCHVIAIDILFLSSNHRSVQFLYLAARAITLAAMLTSRPLSPSRLPLRAHLHQKRDVWVRGRFLCQFAEDCTWSIALELHAILVGNIADWSFHIMGS